ncbi:hypothetical protein P389DRAFT_178673 [Cystobasidium minutum MCA 4210]|uniref:uncharacterized protein n=1 Tax=Cystobasidium minutum MCA 4210 TaxID=1397322 RepID=UPI0034CF6E07|eukprot:jgi/Rhomi1/178673/fgenesh1_pg.3_\
MDLSIVNQPGPIPAQTSPAATLPREVLSGILELAIGDHEIWDLLSDRRPPISALSVLTAVCKSWVAPVRAAFYRDLSRAVLHNSAQMILLYDSLRHSVPPLGRLVRKFDPGTAFKVGGETALKRIFDAMPLLEELSVYVHHVKSLCTHPSWNQLSSLRIRQDTEDEFEQIRLEVETLPAQLSSIEVVGRTDLLNKGPDNRWHAFHLPRIKRFVITCPSLEGLADGLPTPSDRIMPVMPNLETLEVDCFVTEEELQQWLVRIIVDVSSTIKKLIIRRNAFGSFPLNPTLAAKLQRLESFEYLYGPVGVLTHLSPPTASQQRFVN